EAGHEPIPQRLGPPAPDLARARTLPVRGGAGPDRDDFGSQLARQVDRAAAEVDAALAVGGILFEQRRPVLASRVEDEARARLDRDVEAQVSEEIAHFAHERRPQVQW